MRCVFAGWIVVVSLLAGRAWGQIGVYAGFSASKLNVSNQVAGNTGWIRGATFGAYDDMVHLPLVNFGLDVRGDELTGSGGTQVQGGMIGPRAVAHLPIVPLHPYLEGFVGAEHVQAGEGMALTSATHLNYGFAAGLDLTFFPRFDWRVVDYQYGNLSGLYGNTRQQTITTGLVFRLPIP